MAGEANRRNRLLFCFQGCPLFLHSQAPPYRLAFSMRYRIVECPTRGNCNSSSRVHHSLPAGDPRPPLDSMSVRPNSSRDAEWGCDRPFAWSRGRGQPSRKGPIASETFENNFLGASATWATPRRGRGRERLPARLSACVTLYRNFATALIFCVRLQSRVDAPASYENTTSAESGVFYRRPQGPLERTLLTLSALRGESLPMLCCILGVHPRRFRK